MTERNPLLRKCKPLQGKIPRTKIWKKLKKKRRISLLMMWKMPKRNPSPSLNNRSEPRNP